MMGPSPAVFSVASFRPVVGRRAHSYSLSSPSPPRLQMLRPRPRLAIRAQNHVGDGDGDRANMVSLLAQMAKKKKAHNFPKEARHISSHIMELTRVFDGLLHYEAGGHTESVCDRAFIAVAMASLVVDSTSLNLNPTTPGEISRDTVHRTLGVYVQIFVHTADDTFNNTVNRETVTSFLGALRGLASVAHILLQAALDGLSQTHPKESLSENAFNCDVKKMHRVYDRRIRELEDDIRNAPTQMHACKILMPTIREGMQATESFVALMIVRRKRALKKLID